MSEHYNRNIFYHLLIFCSLFFSSSVYAYRHFPPGANSVTIFPRPGIEVNTLSKIEKLVSQSIASGAYPGAVVLAGYNGHLIYQGVFGNRRLEPTVAPMQLDTIFDLASLTKVVATTPAIMQLVERKKINLDKPVAFYWPAFGRFGKANITVRQLLTHTSGLPADLPPSHHVPKNSQCMYSWRGETQALKQIAQLKLKIKPGTQVIYSDVNFVVLAYLVEKITGQRIDQYARKNIYKPLGMKNTFYLPRPRPNLLDQIAPTAIINNKLRWGKVNDPTAYAMNGVAGHAGVFSTAQDLAIYAQAMLDAGVQHKAKKHFLFKKDTVNYMTKPQTPPNIANVRGLGWDIDLILTKRNVLFPSLSYGHTGWTGTSIWINPKTKTWLIILTSRTHPKPLQHNKLIYDRYEIANIVAQSIKES